MATMISNLIGVADKLTKNLGLQVKVSHYAWKSQTATGKPTYGGAVKRGALVDDRAGQRRTESGQTISYRVYIVFVAPVLVNVKDKIVLPNGRTGPIVDVAGGLLNDKTGEGYLKEVWLG